MYLAGMLVVHVASVIHFSFFIPLAKTHLNYSIYLIWVQFLRDSNL